MTGMETRAARIARLRDAYQRERQGDTLPPDLRADLAALRAAGIDFEIVSFNLLNLAPPPAPPREISEREIEFLDARHPMRAMYLYQQACAALRQPVPPDLVANLRAAMRDQQAVQKARQRLSSP